MSDSLLADLLRCLPALMLKTAPADLEYYGRDWTRRWQPAPLGIALPSTVDEVQGIVRWANEHAVGIVPSGGRTGLSGGAVAANGELVLSLERMNRVLGFDAPGRILTVQAGITMQSVHEAADAHGLLYPVDFAARGSCTIGGNIATNAGGIRVIRYGNTRNWIAGLTVVTGAGEILQLNRGLVKNSSGYDLRQLMIGAEGTLGIVVEAQLWLTDAPPESSVMLLALPSFSALMQVFEKLRGQLTLSAFEFLTDQGLAHVVAHGAQTPFDESYPYYVVAEFDVHAGEEAALEAFQHLMEAELVCDGVVAQSQAQAAALWQLREGITESLARHFPYKNDVSVQIGVMPAFLDEAQALLTQEYPQFEVVWFGHIGDGNLHINVLKPDDMDNDVFVQECGRVTSLLAQLLQRHGGSISAEHGIGLVKKPYLSSTRSPEELALMHGIRKVFDPNGVMNPHKLFDSGSGLSLYGTTA